MQDTCNASSKLDNKSLCTLTSFMGPPPASGTLAPRELVGHLLGAKAPAPAPSLLLVRLKPAGTADREKLAQKETNSLNLQG